MIKIFWLYFCLWLAGSVFQPLGAREVSQHPLGKLHSRSLTSVLSKKSVIYHAYVPTAASTEQHLPVVYICAGRGEQLPEVLSLWTSFVEKRWREKSLPPFALVWLPDDASGLHVNSWDGRSPTESVFFQEVMPHAEKEFDLSTQPSQRAILGHKIGACAALRLAGKWPDHFATAVSLDGYFPDYAALQGPEEQPWLERLFHDDERAFLTEHPVTIFRQRSLIIDKTIHGRDALLLLGGLSDEASSHGTQSLRRLLEEMRYPHRFQNVTAMTWPDRLWRGLEHIVSVWSTAPVVKNPSPWLHLPEEWVPGCEAHVFYSTAIGQSIGYTIYLPPEFWQQPEQKYPLVIHLPGYAENEAEPATVLASALDHAIRVGQAAPMILAVINPGPHAQYHDAPHGKEQAETMLMKEFIPQLESRWHVCRDRRVRSLMGAGSGGVAAIRLAAKYPQHFSSALSLAGDFLSAEEFRNEAPDLWKACGFTDDYWEAENVRAVLQKGSWAGQVTLRFVYAADGQLESRHLSLKESLGVCGHELQMIALNTPGSSWKDLMRRCAIDTWRFHTKQMVRP